MPAPAKHTGRRPQDGPGFLDHLGATHAGFLHAKGESATELLLDGLALSAGDRVLDLGCGTGTTLVALARRLPGQTLVGADTSPLMLHTARRRLRICGLGARARFVLLRPGAPLPFPDGAFTKVCCESVLAIQDAPAIRALLGEICRILAPGGLAGLNETVWSARASAEEIARINRRCLERFGLIQSNGEIPRVEDWSALFAEYPLLALERVTRLDDAPEARRRPRSGAERISRLFTLAGGIRRRVDPGAVRRTRGYEREVKSLGIPEKALEGILFLLRRGA
jgi:SAM-dependent methyltransferase